MFVLSQNYLKAWGRRRGLGHGLWQGGGVYRDRERLLLVLLVIYIFRISIISYLYIMLLVLLVLLVISIISINIVAGAWGQGLPAP